MLFKFFMHHYNSFSDHMKALLAETSLKPLHWKVWFLSAMGIFLDGFDLFIVSVALPLIIEEFHPSALIQGMIGASAVLGMMVGAVVGGRLTDRLGRKAIYIVDIIFFIIFTVLSAFSTSSTMLIVFRFLLGIGVGADYPICASYVSETMPSRIRGKMLISAFSFQAFGMIAAALTGLFILTIEPSVSSWRWMLAMGAFPAIVVLIFRISIFESPLWLLAHKKQDKALKVISELTHIKIDKLKANLSKYTEEIMIDVPKISTLFSPLYIKKTILSCVPWFLMDISTYGVGIFTPIILAALIVPVSSNTIAGIFSSVAGAAFVDIFLVVGFVLNIIFIERWGRIKLQVFGFIGMTIGLLILALSSLDADHIENHIILVFLGFTVFNLLMNMGPNATTFTIPAEVYPTKLRATGHGLAAAFAKLGAAFGIFFLPLFKESFGLISTLITLAVFCLIGLFFTLIFQEETKGKVLT